MLVGTFRLGLRGMALEHTFTKIPDLVVEAERVAAHSLHTPMPCIWVASDDAHRVEATLAEDPTIDEVIATNRFSTEQYHHINWATEINEMISSLIHRKGSIVKARGTGDGWTVQIRFITRRHFETFRNVLDAHEVSYDLLDLFQPTTARQTSGGLTTAQREALIAAAEGGYYHIPRKISTRELAVELDMSHQSVSELLRRATENLIREWLAAGQITGDA